MNEQIEFVKQIAERLDSAGIPYMITGSIAMAVYAVPRMTRDIDIVIECGINDALRISRLFETDCYVDENSIKNAIETQSMFNIIHNEWIIKADFIIRKNNEYRKLEFKRRKQFTVDAAEIWIVAPEDLILSKLLWAKDSNSELQRRDVQMIIESVPELDWEYLEKWALKLNIKNLLDELVKK